MDNGTEIICTNIHKNGDGHTDEMPCKAIREINCFNIDNNSYLSANKVMEHPEAGTLYFGEIHSFGNPILPLGTRSTKQWWSIDQHRKTFSLVSAKNTRFTIIKL